MVAGEETETVVAGAADAPAPTAVAAQAAAPAAGGQAPAAAAPQAELPFTGAGETLWLALGGLLSLLAGTALWKQPRLNRGQAK